MAGGLIQIATYGSQDLFLTGTPEITFFKIVYRRHTYFSIESVKVGFDDPVEFGGLSTIKVPKIGDLVHKTYLEVLLPRIDLFRQCLPSFDELEYKVEINNKNYQIIYDFMQVNRNAFVAAYNKYICENNANTATSDMIKAINNVFTKQSNECAISNMKSLLTSSPKAPFNYNEISMESITHVFNEHNSKEQLFHSLNIGIDKSIKTQKYFFEKLRISRCDLEDAMNKNDIELLLDDLQNRTAGYWRRNVSGALLIRMCRTLLRVFALAEQFRFTAESYGVDEGNRMRYYCAAEFLRALEGAAVEKMR